MSRPLLPGLLCVFLTVWAVFAPGESPAAEPVTIGFSSSLSGAYGVMGRMHKRGYELWAEKVNARGGLLGRPVVLVHVDDASDPDEARRIYREFVTDSRVDLVLGPYSSTLTMAVAPITEKHGYPLLASGASADVIWQQGFERVYGVYTKASRYAVGLMEMLYLEGVTDLALLVSDSAFAASAARGIRTLADRYSMSVRFAAAFGSPGADYTELAASSRDSGARAVLVCGHLRESMAMRRALAGLGWTPGVYYATVGPVLDEYQEELGPLAQGTFSSTQWQYHQKQAFPGVHEFHDSFVGKWGEAPSYHAASAYAAGQILEAAAQKTGSLKHDDLARMLSTMDLTTVIGRWGVDPDGMQIRHFALVLQWQDGRKEVVWPRALATAKPRLGP